jgi:hypothetical protein
MNLRLGHIGPAFVIPFAIALLSAALGAAPLDRDADMALPSEDEVGSRKFTTREPAEGDTVIDSVPFIIKESGKYIVTKDLVAEGSAIAVQASDVVIDLNGKTITYGNGEVTTADSEKYAGNGIMTYNSRQKGNIGHAGILLPSRPDAQAQFEGFHWNSDSRIKNVTVRNGKIIDGKGKGLAYGHGIQLSGAGDSRIENVIIEVDTPDTFGLAIGKDGKVKHVTVVHKGTHVSNRHQQVADVNLGPGGEMSWCLLDGGPQAGVKAHNGAKVHHNIIKHRAVVTNCYGVQGYGQKDIQVFANKIMPYNGRGLHVSEKSSNWNVHHNHIEVRETKNKEYSRMQTHGIKFEGTSNSTVHDNVVLSVSSDGGQPTPLNIDIGANTDNRVVDNTFIALTVNKEPAYAVYTVTADAEGTEIRNNAFYSNNVMFAISPDGGKNFTLRECEFNKIATNKEVIFFFNRAYKKDYPNNVRFIDCRYKGVDPRNYYFPGRGAGWRSEGDYAVGNSLTLTVLDDGEPVEGAVLSLTGASKPIQVKSDAEGKISVDLLAFQVIYDRETAKANLTEFDAYKAVVSANGKTKQFALNQPKTKMAATIDLAKPCELILTPDQPHAGRVGEAYNLPLVATANGQWKVVDGELPAGLKLEGAAITGTPTKAGRSKITLQNADVTKDIQLHVEPEAEPFWRQRVKKAMEGVTGPVGVNWDPAGDS